MLKLLRRYKNQVLGFVVPIFAKDVLEGELSNVKLVMTLLVKNESDIIRDTIEFHLTFGVDFIIATDNNSTDGTLEILREYEAKGVLHLIQEPSNAYSQAKWVNRMGDVAYQKYNADLIFHCDADEFWKPRSGNLKMELIKNRGVDVLKVGTRNVILADLNGDESFPQDAKYIVKKVSKKHKVKAISNNRYLNKAHRKVMFNSSKKMLYVGMGNHRVVDPEHTTVQVKSSDITIFHFPSRGKAQFYRKVVEGGEALKQTSDIHESAGAHWRKWYKAYENGELEGEYASMVLNQAAADKLIDLNMIEINQFFPRDHCNLDER